MMTIDDAVATARYLGAKSAYDAAHDLVIRPDDARRVWREIMSMEELPDVPDITVEALADDVATDLASDDVESILAVAWIQGRDQVWKAAVRGAVRRVQGYMDSAINAERYTESLMNEYRSAVPD